MDDFKFNIIQIKIILTTKLSVCFWVQMRKKIVGLISTALRSKFNSNPPLFIETQLTMKSRNDSLIIIKKEMAQMNHFRIQWPYFGRVWNDRALKISFNSEVLFSNFRKFWNFQNFRYSEWLFWRKDQKYRRFSFSFHSVKCPLYFYRVWEWSDESMQKRQKMDVLALKG